MKKKSIAAAVVALAPLFSQAHPGHGGTDGYTIIHYFVEMPHALFSWGGLLAIVGYRYYELRKQYKNSKSSGDA